ncbi:MAG: sulfatase-like hydrolase/transferase [Natronospirillum sp.]
MSEKEGLWKRFAWRAFVALLPLVFIILFALFALPLRRAGPVVLAFLAIVISLHFLVLIVFGLFKPIRRRPHATSTYCLWCVALLLTLPFSFTETAFRVGDVNSILMTIAENRATEMVAVGIEGFIVEFWILVAGTIGLFLLGYLMIKFAYMGRGTLVALALLLLIANPLTKFVFRSIVPHPAQALIAADVEDLAPLIREAPAVQKNLIILYLESLERTYSELEATQEAFAQLAQFEKSGHAFSNLHQLNANFFTAGGLVASQCGVPLLPRGVFNARRRIHDNIDVIPEESDFLSGATCLGDILTEQGYNASYLNGSPLTIFSKGAFFRSHGFQRVKGLESYQGYESEPRSNVWGMDDDLLFERVKDELRWLVDQDQPFVLTSLTIATHGPDGYLDQDCMPMNTTEPPLISAIRCSGSHVKSLLAEVDDLGIRDDTLVVLLSDHLAFKNTLHADLLGVSKQRRNYAVILGDQKTTNMREGTLMDIYPTLLEIMGFELEGNRAGLGRSLIGKTPTLLETFGLNRLNNAINTNAPLQKAIWQDAKAN